MKSTILAAFVALAPQVLLAGPIERACNNSDRGAANPALCACIQQAADLTLSNRDQNRAARFFDDPHEAQEIRQSDRARDEDFWRRYRAFGETAEAYCAVG
jgi:hypothetical protein